MLSKTLFFILSALNITFGFAQSNDSIVFVDFQFLQYVNISSGYHYAFPDICKTSDDSLLILYRTGTSHSGIDGVIVRQKGSPDGLIWSPATTVINDMSTDDRDPSVFRLPNGSIMVIYYKWLPSNFYSNPALPSMYKLFYSVSTDNGYTFSMPVALDTTIMQLPTGYAYTNYTYYDAQGLPIKNFAGTSHAVNAYGKLIYPSYGGNLLAAINSSAPFCFTSDKWRIYLHESTDNGITWNYRCVNETTYPNVWLSEPCICDLGYGKMIMHMRTSADTCEPSAVGHLLQSFSYDAGETWTTPQSLQIIGAQAAYLFKTSKGVLISAFRIRPTDLLSFQKTAFIYSIDNGLTWSQPVLIENCWAECGYPSIIELDTNKIMIVYYSSSGTGITGAIYKLNIEYFNQTLSDKNLDFNDNKITLYPNPTQGEVNIEYNFARDKEINLTLYNSIGTLVYKENYIAGIGEYKKYYNFSDLPAGIYYISMQNQGKEIRKKLIINR